MRLYQTKNISYSVKDVDEAKGIVTLYASAFGNVDSVGDIVMPGAFTKTITEGKNRIMHLWQHDSYEPIGRPQSLIEDSKGLLVESFITTAKNGDYRKLYAEGIINEHSIGYSVIKEESDHQKGVNYLKELKLYEYSSVTWGANSETPTIGMKSMIDITPETLIDRLEKLQRFFKNGTATDETMIQIDIEIKQIQTQIISLVKNQEPPTHSKDNEPKPKIDLLTLYNSL